MKLYEISEMYEVLMSLDLTEEELMLHLQNLTGEIETKVENIGKILSDMDGDIEKIKEEERRLKEKRSAIEGRKSALKEYLKMNMETLGLQKIKTPLYNVSIQKNRASVRIIDESLIPEDYFKIERTPIKADIEKALKEGLLTDAAELVQTESLRIR